MQSQQMTQNVLNKPPQQQYRIPAIIKQTVRPALAKPTQLNRGVTPRMKAPRSVTSGATSLGGGATTIRLSSNQMAPNQTPIQRRQISTITATTTNTSGPVYHTINGYRIDLNSASKQDNFRLPNGKLIQVKRQLPVMPGAQQPQPAPVSSTITSPTQTYSLNQQYIRPTIRQQINQQHQQMHHQQQQQIIIQRNPPAPQQFIIHTPPMQQQQMQQQQQQHMHQQHMQQQQHQQQPPPTIQYRQIPQLQPTNQQQIPPGVIGQQNIALKSIPNFIKQIFPSTPLGVARNTLQSQLFHTMEICHHLMTKTHTMTNSNAYKAVHNLMDIKELYIHLSYLLTYAIGRFKGLQDKCLNDMKALGFTQEARNLEKGQLAKGEFFKRIYFLFLPCVEGPCDEPPRRDYRFVRILCTIYSSRETDKRVLLNEQFKSFNILLLFETLPLAQACCILHHCLLNKKSFKAKHTCSLAFYLQF